MAQFVQTHSGGKALLYEGYKHLKIHDGKECAHFGDARGTRAKGSKSDYILTFKGKEESAFHICHNLEWRCTCSFVHAFMQSLTVDFVGS